MYYRKMRTTWRAVRFAFAALLLWAAYWGFRLALADYWFRTDTEHGRQRAVALVPFRADYQAGVGNWSRAVELNDYYSRGWIELGLRAESALDFALAERHLLKAASVDRLFEPRWALANYYLRRSNTAEFWKWARLAAERSYGDRTGLFRLSLRVTPNPEEIVSKIFPSDMTLRREFVTFLAAEGQLDAAARLAQPLAAGANQEWVADLCDRLLEAGLGEQAHNLAGSPLLLTNGELRAAPRNKAFDWRLHWRAGIHTSWSPGEIRIELSGKQPEAVDLISQYVWVEEPGAYRFRYRYRTEGLARESGVRWTLEGAPYLSSAEWRTETVEFPVRKPKQLVRLELQYKRAAGTVRQEGTIFFEGAFHLDRTAALLTTLK